MFIDIPIQAEDMNLTKNQAAMLLSILGATQTITCIPWGIIADKKWTSIARIVVTGSLLSGVSLCISLAYNNFETLVIKSVIFRIGSGEY